VIEKGGLIIELAKITKHNEKINLGDSKKLRYINLLNSFLMIYGINTQ